VTLRFHDCLIPAETRAAHINAGGRGLCRKMAKVPDGELRLMAGEEPLADGDALTLHVSASVGKPGVIPAFRRPSDAEMDAVRSLWPDVTFEEDNGAGRGEKVRHLWAVQL
jgi:hypothetical protein